MMVIPPDVILRAVAYIIIGLGVLGIVETIWLARCLK